MAKLPDDYRPPHIPYQLDTKAKYEKLEREIVGAIRDGLPIKDAFILAGINPHTFYRWRDEFIEDIQDGFTGTNLIMLMTTIMKEDKAVFRRISKKMLEKADEGDTRILMYLADNRFGYANKRKNNVEIGAASKDKGVEINIVNMTSVDSSDDDENVIEAEVIEKKEEDD